MEIIIDFDGTCVAHDFPRIGKGIGAVTVLKELVANGHRLILFTMRADRTEYADPKDDSIQDRIGNFLTDAVDWFAQNEIPLYGIQTNPTQHNWTTSPKAYGHLMIDDSAVGTPLMMVKGFSEKPFVDWVKMKELLIKAGAL